MVCASFHGVVGSMMSVSCKVGIGGQILQFVGVRASPYVLLQIPTGLQALKNQDPTPVMLDRGLDPEFAGTEERGISFSIELSPAEFAFANAATS